MVIGLTVAIIIRVACESWPVRMPSFGVTWNRVIVFAELTPAEESDNVTLEVCAARDPASCFSATGTCKRSASVAGLCRWGGQSELSYWWRCWA